MHQKGWRCLWLQQGLKRGKSPSTSKVWRWVGATKGKGVTVSITHEVMVHTFCCPVEKEAARQKPPTGEERRIVLGVAFEARATTCSLHQCSAFWLCCRCQVSSDIHADRFLGALLARGALQVVRIGEGVCGAYWTWVIVHGLGIALCFHCRIKIIVVKSNPSEAIVCYCRSMTQISQTSRNHCKWITQTSKSWLFPNFCVRLKNISCED